MEREVPPEVVREKTSRVADGHVSCALVFNREFSQKEIERFLAQPAPQGRPGPRDFLFDGRIVRYDCPEEEEAKWRLAFQILFVKAFRSVKRETFSDSGIRARAGLRRLHLG